MRGMGNIIVTVILLVVAIPVIGNKISGEIAEGGPCVAFSDPCTQVLGISFLTFLLVAALCCGIYIFLIKKE